MPGNTVSLVSRSSFCSLFYWKLSLLLDFNLQQCFITQEPASDLSVYLLLDHFTTKTIFYWNQRWSN